MDRNLFAFFVVASMRGLPRDPLDGFEEMGHGPTVRRRRLLNSGGRAS